MINCAYLHIPFCKKKCNYCAFCSYDWLSAKEKYIEALISEIKFLYKKETLKTIYFGGGTPSLLDEREIERILGCFNFDCNTEITLEANPNSIDLKKLKNLKSMGINRLSLGLQSFDDKILKTIGRTHDSKQALEAVENIKKSGFDNFSIDLMYGLPDQNLKLWKKTLNEALNLNPAHISLYGLKIEKGTYFYKFLPKNLPSPDLQAKMYEIAAERLAEKYIHYEVSNFASKKKYFSKHNLAYWKCQNYYGFGLSASGYIENRRYTNTNNFSKYLKNPQEKNYQTLKKQELIEEEIYLGLRLCEGIDFEAINKKHGINIYQKYKKEFDKFIDMKLMEKTQNGAKLTQRGILVQNEILCEFIEIN